MVFIDMVRDYAGWSRDLSRGWLLSPAAWTQVGMLAGAWFVAIACARILRAKPARLIDPGDAVGIIARLRRFVPRVLPLPLPIFAFGFTAIGKQATPSVFGTGTVIAFGKRVFLFLAPRILVKQVITEPFLNFLGRFVLIPIAFLYALGLIEPVSLFLTETMVGVGNTSFSAMAIARGLIAGAILFWLGMWRTQKSASCPGHQQMRPAIRQLTIKAAAFFIVAIALIVPMNVMGINLSSPAVIGGAVGVGLGFGLRKIASNFISGVIALVEGQATVDNDIGLDGGEAGRLLRMMARATILETCDGRRIFVPKEDFITTRAINYPDAGAANRHEAKFSARSDTDINRVPDIVAAAVATHPDVLSVPEGPDVALCGSGDSGIGSVVEIRVNGVDDGLYKYTSDVLSLVWNALRDNGIKIPYPQRVIQFKGALPEGM